MPQQTSNKKVVASKGGRKISTPLGIFIAIVAAALLALVGTYGYSVYNARSLSAKAGSRIVPFKNYEYRNGKWVTSYSYLNGLQIGLCKKMIGARTYATTIAAVDPVWPTSLRSADSVRLRLTTYQPGGNGGPGSRYQSTDTTNWTYGWFGTNKRVSLLSLSVPGNGWAEAEVENRYGSNPGILSKSTSGPVSLLFIPWC